MEPEGSLPSPQQPTTKPRLLGCHVFVDITTTVSFQFAMHSGAVSTESKPGYDVSLG